MDDGFDAAARRIRGSIKEAIGMLIGDPVVEAEGAAEKNAVRGQAGADHPDIEAPRPDAGSQ